MDPGSILALATCGLQSIKVFHRILSTIRDRPAKLDDLQKAIWNLQHLLEQICSDPTLPHASEYQRQTTEIALLQCKDDVQRLMEKMNKFGFLPEERSHGKVRKMMNLVLGEKEINDMLATISRHLATLALQTNIQQMTTLAKINDRNQNIQVAVDNIAHRVAEMSSTLVQAIEISANLNELRTLYGTLLSRSPYTTNKLSGDRDTLLDSLGGCQQNVEAAKLLQNVASFAKFVDEKERTVTSDEASDIVSALESVVRFVSEQLQQTREDRNHRRHISQKEYVRRLEKLTAHFVWAPRLRLNDQRFLVSSNKHLRTGSRSFHDLEIGPETARLASSTELRLRRKGHCTETRDSVLESEYQYNATVTFRVRQGHYPRTFIKASIAYQSHTSGVLSAMPCISVSRVVPNDSKVFFLIRQGRLDLLRQLLQDGNASLRDRDEYGASLLHYAAQCHHPEIVDFLIRYNADVNDLADARHTVYSSGPLVDDAYVVTPLHLVGCTEPELEGTSDEFERELRTFRCLLAGGADSPSYSRLLWYYPREFVLAVLDPDTSVVDPENIVQLDYATHRSCVQPTVENLSPAHISALSEPDRMTGLHFLLCNLRIAAGLWRHDFASIKSLIQRGADIHGTYNGMTCSALAYSRASWTGDVWDAALASFGHDVRSFRVGHPRKVQHTSIYSRDTFEEMWSGMERLCPYYDRHFDGQIYDALENSQGP